jgi:hypothetical protein
MPQSCRDAIAWKFKLPFLKINRTQAGIKMHDGVFENDGSGARLPPQKPQRGSRTSPTLSLSGKSRMPIANVEPIVVPDTETVRSKTEIVGFLHHEVVRVRRNVQNPM